MHKLGEAGPTGCWLLLHFVVVVVAFPYTVESHKEKKKRCDNVFRKTDGT